ncbi:MAG: AMP-binding protein, partial [Deltaproteobacteria bacterium]|nr:AMP-binding protein [Deltaproteobacteria bacterium]
MLVTEILARNARMYGDEVALVERDPEKGLRSEMTWKEFDEQANKFANALMEKGIKKGDKVIHLMMNCLEWLPAYFGILRTGAWAVPLNFRFTADDILYCARIAEAKAMIYGEQFIDRVDAIRPDLETIENFFFVGEQAPKGTENFKDVLAREDATAPKVELHYEDEAGLYFTSGTTGQPKPILLTHKNLESACITENRHHLQTHEDNFLLIP